MKKEIDLRGLTCPEPVLRTKRLLDDKQVLNVEALVDGEVNVNNLSRLARSLGLQLHSVQERDFYRVSIAREGGEKAAAPTERDRPQSQSTNESGGSPTVGTVVFLGKDRFGDGDPEFSNTLMSLFLQTMFESGQRPRAILMANSGVRLMAKDSSSLKVLQDFKSNGVEVLACGLCVEYYKLGNDIPKEQITNMFAICEYMFAADRLLTP